MLLAFSVECNDVATVVARVTTVTTSHSSEVVIRIHLACTSTVIRAVALATTTTTTTTTTITTTTTSGTSTTVAWRSVCCRCLGWRSGRGSGVWFSTTSTSTVQVALQRNNSTSHDHTTRLAGRHELASHAEPAVHTTVLTTVPTKLRVALANSCMVHHLAHTTRQ